MIPLRNSVYKLCVTLRQAFLCLAFLSATTYAQTQYALLIGISQYKEVTPLQFADRDAVAFAEFLKTQQVPEDNIKLFLNENATRFNIVDELYNTSQSLKKGDRFYFYFGGHGDLEARIGYENSLLLLYNSFKKSYFQGNEYLQLSELKTWFNDLTKKGVEVVFIADACHSGGLIGGKEGNTKTQKALQESWANITKILSCKADEFSLEGKQWGGGRGISSYHLVNGLTGRADANKDQKVTLSELSNYLTTNVLREANPNIQTPVILGNNTQFLSKVSKEGLAKLADYEKRNIPIITEVNLKGGEERDNLLISKLDTTLVYTYKQFMKALKAKRLNTFDDSTAKDYALLHYKKLMARKIPDHLVPMLKRSLGEGLMERELVMMQDVREKGREFVAGNADLFLPVIRNLEEAMKLFDPTHYFYNSIKARKLIIESERFSKMTGQKQKQLESLLMGDQLEPNMVSTYAFLSNHYRSMQKPDSAIYYQEKVIELLPNQALAYCNVAYNYLNVKYTDANNQPAVHPKAIESFEKAIQIEPNLWEPYTVLGHAYMGRVYSGSPDKRNFRTSYPKAIPYLEKGALLLEQLFEKGYQERLKLGINKYSQNQPYNENYVKIYRLIDVYVSLYATCKESGNTLKAEEYLAKLHQKLNMLGSISLFLEAASSMCMIQFFSFEKDDTYQHNTLNLLLSALKTADEDLKVVPADRKPNLTFLYRELLKSVGAVHRTLKNYTEAESFFQQALAYPVLTPASYNERFQMFSSYILYQNRYIVEYFSVQQNGYSVDVNLEMALLKSEQNKPDEALVWLEKALQNPASKKEKFIKKIFSKSENLNKEAYQALLDKYFPPTPNEKK